ncbi:MAG: RNA pyrophosphohydrolase [Gammaproteobacteria bacterium]|nr:RNA pyrophosphohydrolase [Gammaproteobacteria bacterium]MAY02578.1 RNA pyrophosphohydrolase [Gammaproteobacteria bacterium]
MVDADGFRPNVGIIIFNDDGKLLWAKRAGQNAWQFPQGGIRSGESPEDALHRELYEEVGLQPQHVEIITRTQKWLPYRLPKQFIRQNSEPVCIGQKQKWFLLRLVGDSNNICFDRTERPEFDRWRWISYWKPLDQVIAFKRDVYRRALKEFQQPMSQALGNSTANTKRTSASAS